MNGIENLGVYISELKILIGIEKLQQSLKEQILKDYMDWQILLDYVGYLDQRYSNANFVISFLKTKTDYLLFKLSF